MSTPTLLDSPAVGKSAAAFKTISEVSSETGVPQHVLRFWEGKFSQLRPLKRGGGRRYYRPEDLALLQRIRRLLHEEGYTIKGVQKLLREQRGGEVEDTRAPAAPSPVVRSNPLPRPAPGVFARTRAAFAADQSRTEPNRRLVLDVERVGESGGQAQLLRDVLEDLQTIRSFLKTI